MRPSRLLTPLLFTLALPAQGIVNASLLHAPTDDPVGARSSAAAAVAAKARAAVVHVLVEVSGPRGKFPIQRSSSGVVVDASGLILTWAHLVAEAQGAGDKSLLVQLDDAAQTRLPAKVVRSDTATGLTLLQVAPPGGRLDAVELGADHAAPGEPVLVLARPEGKELLAFGGVASTALADVTLGGRTLAAADVVMTDARPDERCDGAPVLDLHGRLVGLCASEHVRRDVSDPTLDDLRQPSFTVVVPSGTVRATFAREFAAAAAANPTLRRAPAADPFGPTAAAVQRIAPSVVGVWGGEGEWPTPVSSDPGAAQRRAGLGSGVALGNGLVVTNAHLCNKGQARLRTRDGKTFAAKVVKTDLAGNLALLRADLPAGVEPAAAACAPDGDVHVGETMLAIGCPYGTGALVTGGVISAVRGDEGGRIQADANLGEANGGGAVVDASGRLLGIVDAGMVDPLEMAFHMRGDRISVETNLSTFVSIRRLRRVFADELGGAAAPVPATAEQAQLRATPLVAMVEKTHAAMLNIYVGRNKAVASEDDPFAGIGAAEMAPESLGSGVIIDRSGLAISNWHVVDSATHADGAMRSDYVVRAAVFGGKVYDVRVLSISREDDLSLLQLVLAPGEEVQAVELGSSDALAVGEAVAAIGNPHGRSNTVTFGVVTTKEQGIKVRGRWRKLEHLIETDAAINGGNSGGALLDMNGRLVGINSAGGGTFTNKGYAIAVDHVRSQVLGLLFASYKLRSPELGLRAIDGDGDGSVVVMDVDPRGPAMAAGVQSGDRIRALDGVAITWSPGFAMQLLQKQPGQAVHLDLERKGQALAKDVTPLEASVWAVIRQSGLQCRTFGFGEDPDGVREAAIALHRQFTGDERGEPTTIPESIVRVDAVVPGAQPEGVDLAAGDLILAVEFVDAEGQNPVLMRIGSVVELQRLFNDRLLNDYEGQEFRCWVARGKAVRRVAITAKRLFW